MKRKSVILILGFLVAAAAYATNKYTEAMKKGMDQLSAARSPEQFVEAANTFDRISSVEVSEWMPAYYAAYARTMVAAMGSDQSQLDKNLDLAQGSLDKAVSLSENPEVMALQGFIYMLRIQVDPQNRGPEFSMKSSGILSKAQALDPDNPRVLHLLAQLSFGTSQFFGSDTSEACGLNQKAIARFETYKAKSDSPFYPSWGKNMALGFQERCK